jgi:uncharacterized protein involved in outer membrane biogenesis
MVFIAYSAAAYFGVPAVLRYLAQHQAAAALHRQVTVGDIKFNPYRLRLVIDDLHVGGRDHSQHFIDINRIDLRLSWTSLSHLTFVAKALIVKQPSIRIERTAPGTFNFSDLLAAYESQKSNRAPLLFAVSNIEVRDGLILFEDQVLKSEHRLADIRLAIPFIANLPTDTNIYVQPMLEMTVDGSPFSLAGKTKPFGSNMDSTVAVSFQNLDLTRFARFAADEMPFKLKQADLSAALRFDFILAAGHPQLQVAGTAKLENVAINDLADSPLAELKQMQIGIAQLQPLVSKLHFSSIGIDSPSFHLVVNHGGRTNLDSLLGRYRTPPSNASHTKRLKPAAAQPTQSMKAKPAPVTSQPLLNPMAVAPLNGPPVPAASSGSGGNAHSTVNPPFSLSVDSLELNNGAVDITDKTEAAPVHIRLQAIHLGLKNFANAGGAPISYNFSANLDRGGRLASNGSFDLSSSRATGNLGLVDIDLPALQSLMTPVLAATIVSGKFSAHTAVQAELGGHFNVHAEHAQITIDGVELRPVQQAQNTIGWKHFTANIDQFDLAAHQAVIRELHGDGLHLTALRDSQGNLNLASLFRGSRPISQERSQPIAPGIISSAWQYRIESLVLENADVAIEDDSLQPPVSLRITPFNIRLRGLTNDFAKPFIIEADGNMTRRATFKVAGEIAIKPFQGRFHINTERINVAWLDPFISRALGTRKLNVKITDAVLTMNGDAQARFEDSKIDAAYNGSVTLGRVKMVDKLTGESFLRWYALSLDGLEIRYGPSKPRVRIDAMALSDFYARLILNADGRLNLRDIVTGPKQPSVPITLPSVKPSRETTVAAPPANIANITVESLTLNNGEVNYLDNFIKPNYSADITQLEGKVGAFGTNSATPAEVVLAGKVNGTSPVSISGSINPLAPMASLNVQGNASRIELPPLSPYAAKYTGYPITGGMLSGSVHYILANRHLTATNHLILDRLSFGDRPENSSISNLPIRLAVAVMKDSQGRIYLSIPISGSLSDPQFDFGRIIWNALSNLIIKAATSPFSVLASAIGGEDHSLSYVKFAPGYATLSGRARHKLATLAALLKQRPWLKLQISGRVDPKVDRPALREAILDDEIKQQKAKSEHISTSQVEVTPDEYNKYLWRVYKAADFAKPRNVLGMTKWLPPDEIKKMLLAHIIVSDEDLQHLAEARATAVYQILSARVEKSRLLVAAPKVNAEGAATRADFSLK